MSAFKQKRIGEMLLERGAITEEQLEEALADQREKGELLGETLVRLGYLGEEVLLDTLSEMLNLPRVDLTEQGVVDPDVVKLVSESLARRYRLVALQVRDGMMYVAMSNPRDLTALDTIKQQTKLKVQPVLALENHIRHAIEQFYQDSPELHDGIFDDEDLDLIDESKEDAVDVGDHEAAPVVKYVNALIVSAIKERSSDIHIEAFEKEAQVRFRVDGKLRAMQPPPRRMLNAIAARIKVISGLDIAERRLPQDGRCKVRLMNRDVDIRVSTLPMIHGEKIVLRLLDKSATSLDITALGMEQNVLDMAKKLLNRPYGIILLCGPTGSGKTTTLYSFLSYVNRPDVNVVTVEDPVEYQLVGINQVQARPNIGLDFAAGLRSILRQDPDIIMVGEIRDPETLEMAIKAALTGHLVFSTLHTNNAVASIQRMVNMGTEPFLISSTLTAAVSQRLVRKICPRCKTIYKPPQDLLMALYERFQEPLEGVRFCQGRGCPQCSGSGYYGRCAVHELFFVNSIQRDMIARGANEIDLQQQARQDGMQTIVECAFQKVKRGEISIEECLSLLYDAESL